MPEYVTEVMYDRDCGFCVWCADKLRRMDRRGRVVLATAQTPGALDRFGITVDDALSAAWALDSRGELHRGAAAVNSALSAILGVRLPLMIYRIPGIRWLQDTVYAWVATNRYRFPGSSAACAVDR